MNAFDNVTSSRMSDANILRSHTDVAVPLFESPQTAPELLHLPITNYFSTYSLWSS